MNCRTLQDIVVQNDIEPITPNIAVRNGVSITLSEKSPFVEPQLFVTVEQANQKLKDVMKVTDPTTGLYKSIQRITDVTDMMLRRQDQLRKLYEPSENVKRYLERIKQLVDQITKTKINELPVLSKTVIPQLEGEVSGYVETFESALAEKEKEIESLKAELESLRAKAKI